MSAEWRADQGRCLWDVERHSVADQSYLEDGIRVLELAKDAQRLCVFPSVRLSRSIRSTSYEVYSEALAATALQSLMRSRESVEIRTRNGLSPRRLEFLN